ncbi:hypothetical protein B0H13DRAFT_133385 [Mycena leptocephala]|nr:hypothetical protein B0H13DRAFT_133385 [Mycena leptocephala]
MPAQPTEMCENCTVARKDLRRCAGCSLIRYCSKECQKAHWKQHKPHCAYNVKMAKKADTIGPDYSVRLKAIGKWCDQFSIPIGAAALNALELMKHPERVDESVLIIYVEFLGTAKAPYTYDVTDAIVLPIDLLRARALAVSPEQLQIFERGLAPRPGMARVMLIDKRFPWSYNTSFLLAPNIRTLPYDPLWFEHLQINVTRPGQPVRSREHVPLVELMHGFSRP